jgi:iron complex transport system substrate-binding protein
MAPPRRVPFFLAVCLALAACAAVQPPTPDGTATDPGAAAYPLTVTDDAGRRVAVEAEPQRIVSLAPSNTEIVCAIGACDRLVGVTDFDDHPPEVGEIEDVVIAAVVDVERVVAAEPDLVLAAGNELTPSTVIQQLDELGLTVLVLYPETLEGIYDDIGLLGRVLGRGSAASEVVGDMQRRVDAVVAAVAGAERPVTLYEVFHAEGLTYTAGDGSFLASLLELAGAEPVTGDPQGLLPPEELVAADPELILLGTASYDPALSDPQTALRTVAERAAWSDLRAVRDGNVVPYRDDVVTTRPGPRIVEGLEALARAIHPDRFE